jgi:F0F1-type ATP synthase assembly protein I
LRNYSQALNRGTEDADVDDLKGRQEPYDGFGETVAKGIEFALTLAIFLGLGYGLDRLTGLLPVFTILFVVVGLVGLGTKTYYTYEARMRALDASSPWGRRRDR